MYTPIRSSPLARKVQIMDPSPSPTHPSGTAKMWDEDERRATVNPKSDIVLRTMKSYEPHSVPKTPPPSPSGEHSPFFDFGPPVLCKMCKHPKTSLFGPCEKCKMSPLVPPSFADFPAPPTPTAKISTPRTPKECSGPSSAISTPMEYSGPPSANLHVLGGAKRHKAQGHRPSIASLYFSDLPIDLSPLYSPTGVPPTPRSSREEVTGSQTPSLTDPHIPYLRSPYIPDVENAAHVPVAHSSMPSTPPSTPRGGHSKLASPGTPPYPQAHVKNASGSLSRYALQEQMNLTSMESRGFLARLARSPTSTGTTSPRSRATRESWGLQNPVSAWDDWDSDEEEKAGLVKYWQELKWRSTRGSLRASGSQNEGADQGGNEGKKGKKMMGFVRMLGCGSDKN